MISMIKKLGHHVDKQGIRTNPVKINAVSNFSVPFRLAENFQKLRFLCSYFRRFIPHFANLARPLTNLSKKKVPFHWDDYH